MIVDQLINIDHQAFYEDLAFTFLRILSSSFHILVVSLSTHINQLFMELICGQLLQKKLRCKQEVQFNHGIIHEALIVKGVFGKFKNEKKNKKGACYNCGTKGHLQNNVTRINKIEIKNSRFFTSTHIKQNKTSCDYCIYFFSL
jgi:hypothetical protein